jgi:rhodanese-related sulfurtransferase
MAPFPLNLGELLGHWESYMVYLAIGLAFGYVLEISGFGNSRKLAAQFYFTDMTVFKVMFGTIIVAMVGIFLVTGLGLLDYNLIWVNPTYLWPGIIGGLIMGVGFIVGGFCPGTSLVAAATGKLDGMVFVLGVFFGIFLFGESVSLFDDFWMSSFMGRFTLMDLFNVDTGIIVFAIVVLAIIAFFFAELSEKHIGKMNLAEFGKWRYGAAAGMIVLAGMVLLVGQPTNTDKWERIATVQQERIENREIYAQPGEILHLLEDPKITVQFIDVRTEAEYNLFHVLDSIHVPFDDVLAYTPIMHATPSNTVFMLMGNNETLATEAWKILMAEAVPNIYVAEGGINNWINTFAEQNFIDEYSLVDTLPDALAFGLPSALGSRYVASDPNPDVFDLSYAERVKLEVKRGPASGGCG